MTMRRRHYPAPEPQAIDPASGFKVPLSNLVRQWDGEMIDRRFVDQRNPQDFVRGRAERMALPFSRPEAPDRGMATDIDLEDGTPFYTEDNQVLLNEGEVPAL